MDKPKELFYDYMYRGDYVRAKEELQKLRGKSKIRANVYFNERVIKPAIDRKIEKLNK